MTTVDNNELATKGDMRALERELDLLNTELTNGLSYIKQNIKGLRTEVTSLKDKASDLRVEIAGLKDQVFDLRSEILSLKSGTLSSPKKAIVQ